MKCTKCGKNEANVHYKSNYNGKVTEAHLCSNCANEMGVMDNFAEDMFSDFFGGFFGRRAFSPYPFGSLMMPVLTMPRLEIKFDEPKTEEKEEVNEAVSKKRELNELREKLNKAVEEERFEECITLRDRIKELEK